MSGIIQLNEHELMVTTSIGIAVYPKDDMDAEALIKAADAAMYRAKELGQNRYQFYTEELNVKALERLALETGLQKALKNNEFELYYQPKVAIDDKCIVSFEALIRWHHPERGLVPPNDFIPFLEDSGLIIPVGEWVLFEACRQNKAWQQSGMAPMRVAVNISARQFKSEALLGSVLKALKQSQLDPQYLELELTESMFIENAELAINTMVALKAIGVRLAIDDFGSGYSSLSYLKRFPIDFLKIDRSFIKDLCSSEKDAAITASISALARSLGVGLVAEGVENEAQVQFLQDKGCDELQGFLFSKPLPPEAFFDWVRTSLQAGDVKPVSAVPNSNW
jgi:EAL domain-containing protein (putative c-di-GMP-specific phosphodiesterase class I)